MCDASDGEAMNFEASPGFKEPNEDYWKRCLGSFSRFGYARIQHILQSKGISRNTLLYSLVAKRRKPSPKQLKMSHDAWASHTVELRFDS